MSHEALRVVESRGIDLGTTRGLGANLVINFGQIRYFSKRTLQRYVEWIADRFDRLLVIVADHPEAHSLHALKGMPLDAARRRALDFGREIAASYRRAIPGSVANRVSVALASDLLGHPSCAALVERIQAARAERTDISEAMNAAVRHVLASKIATASRNGSLTDAALESLASSLVEQVAIVLHVSHQTDPRHPVTIVPDVLPAALAGIDDTPLGALVADVTRGERLRSIVLRTRDGTAARLVA